jgi:hypothetical protein
MSNLAEMMAGDQRLIMLRSLDEATATTLNETILKMCLYKFGHVMGRDQVRTELQWLAEQRLVRLERLPTGDGEFWVAHLTADGAEVAQGRAHHGVARRVPG